MKYVNHRTGVHIKEEDPPGSRPIADAYNLGFRAGLSEGAKAPGYFKRITTRQLLKMLDAQESA